MMAVRGRRNGVSRLGTASIRAYTAGKRIRNTLFTSTVRRGFAHFGAASSLALPCGISRAEYVSVGDGVVLGPHCKLIVVGDMAAGHVAITLEDGVSVIGFCTISAACSVVVGAGALFARNVYISDHNHAFRDTTRPVKDQGINAVAPVRIGRGAWLGENVVILPGVAIGDGAVVGANSVVRESVPAFSLAVGSPARVVRSWAENGGEAPCSVDA